VLEGVIPLETFPLAEWHYGELADVPRFTVLKTQICVTHPQCVNMLPSYIKTELDNPKKFKVVLQKFLYENYFYSSDEYFKLHKS